MDAEALGEQRGKTMSVTLIEDPSRSGKTFSALARATMPRDRQGRIISELFAPTRAVQSAADTQRFAALVVILGKKQSPRFAASVARESTLFVSQFPKECARILSYITAVRRSHGYPDGSHQISVITPETACLLALCGQLPFEPELVIDDAHELSKRSGNTLITKRKDRQRITLLANPPTRVDRFSLEPFRAVEGQ